MNGVTVFRPIKNRRKVDLDILAKVVAQMQGLIDSPVDPENPTEVAYHGLTERWHAMLQDALINEAKRN